MQRRRCPPIRYVMQLVALSWIAAAVAATELVSQPTSSSAAQTRSLPTTIADTTFWGMVTRMSEAGGQFQSDNFTSNEGQYPDIIVDILARNVKGGAYIGVGPEQNFQYIAALRPQIVFQLDIRRQMIVQHLMYKAVFELTADRADFLSLLFSKPRPPGITAASAIDQIWDAYWFVPTDTTIFQRNFARIRDHLTQTHGFALSADDVALLSYVYETFYRNGPIISYNGISPEGANFASLTWARDSDGTARSFLASEDNFRVIKDMHHKNLIIPVVADFAGFSGIRSVAKYLHDHNTKVNAFYVSNVESYLFRNGVSAQFYTNVASLPIDSTSVFIRPSGAPPSRAIALRSSVMQGGGIITVRLPSNAPDAALCPIKEFLAHNAVTPIASFAQANMCGR